MDSPSRPTLDYQRGKWILNCNHYPRPARWNRMEFSVNRRTPSTPNLQCCLTPLKPLKSASGRSNLFRPASDPTRTPGVALRTEGQAWRFAAGRKNKGEISRGERFGEVVGLGGFQAGSLKILSNRRRTSVMRTGVAQRDMDKKSNIAVANSNDVHHEAHVAPKVSNGNVQAEDYELEECAPECSVVEICNAQNGTGSLEGKIEKPVVQKSSSSVHKIPVHGNLLPNHTVPQPFHLETEVRHSCMNYFVGSDASAVVTCLSEANHSRSPNATKKSHPTSPVASTPSQFSRKLHDEDDNWSLTSSVAASVRSAKFRVTMGSAPSFKCNERAEKRKQFYAKLEQKHQALEAEKNQAEARTKEEQEAAIKQLRKNMVVKANPVPNFYQEGPPPKVELKKLPLTRAVSPKFGRRKSCGDAVKPSNDVEKGRVCSGWSRHSLGSVKGPSDAASPVKSKDHAGMHGSNGVCKVKGGLKQAKEVKKAVTPRKMSSEQRNSDIAVQS